MGQLRAGGRALNRPTWSLVKGSSASLPQPGSVTVGRQRFFGIPATDSDMADAPRPDEILVVMAILTAGGCLIGAVPSNLWNHRGAATSSICPRRHSTLGAPPHGRLWDRRNGSMRSPRVKRRYCAVKGLVPAGRSGRSRLFPRVLLRGLAVRGRSNRSHLAIKIASLAAATFRSTYRSPLLRLSCLIHPSARRSTQ
jgi:hypothetical protein